MVFYEGVDCSSIIFKELFSCDALFAARMTPKLKIPGQRMILQPFAGGGNAFPVGRDLQLLNAFNCEN